MQLAMNARSFDGAVLIVVSESSTLVAPEGEFPLGKVGPDDRIVQEMRGTRLVNVRLLRKDEAGRLR
jgi:hypothetical protein